MRNIKTVLYTIVVFFILVSLFFLFTTTTKPWEGTGRIVISIGSVPFNPTDTTFTIGIDDIELYTSDGDVKKIRTHEHRVTFKQEERSLQIIADYELSATTYTGFKLRLKNPELRNNWEDDTAPSSVLLRNEEIMVPSPFTITKDNTSAIIIRLETLQSIREDADKKIYLPVAQVEIRNDTNVITTEGICTIQGGVIEHSGTYGMDWDGAIHFNYRAPVSREEITEQNIVSPQNKQSTSTPETPFLNQSTSTATTSTEDQENNITTIAIEEKTTSSTTEQ